jgi:hypothetical protein
MPRRPRRLRYHPPPLTEDLLLAWAGHEHALAGRWPTSTGGEVAAAPAEKWRNVSVRPTAWYRNRHWQRGAVGSGGSRRDEPPVPAARVHRAVLD